MLLLLSRLYPSTLDDGGDSSMSLQPFIPLVLRYHNNYIYNYSYSIMYVCIHYVCLYVSTVCTWSHGCMLCCRCAKSSVWKIRKAASRALLTLLSQTELTKCIELLYSNGLGAKCTRQNHTHGLLLMLYAILADIFPSEWETGAIAIYYCRSAGLENSMTQLNV